MIFEVFNYKNLETFIYEEYGTAYVDALLLDQYKSSPRFLSYLAAYSAEFDLLFAHTKRVHLGRYLEFAEGKQLDILGDIVGISRHVALPDIYFGFQGASGIDGMADENAPLDGGVFLSENFTGFEVVPLSDVVFKRAIRAKAYLNSNRTEDINSTYRAIAMLLNRIPRMFHLETLGPKEARLNINKEDINNMEKALLLYMSKHFLPNATIFNLNVI